MDIEENVTPDPNTGCWLWERMVDRNGYGRLWHKGKPMQFAHRVSYENYRGEIPSGLCVCHKCDTPGCVNPDHLFLGTRSDNMADRQRKGRQPAGEKNGRARLTIVQVKEIKERLFLGEKKLRLAKEYNVGERTIRDIASGKNWSAS